MSLLKSEEETVGAGAAACCCDADWQSCQFGEEGYSSSANEVYVCCNTFLSDSTDYC